MVVPVTLYYKIGMHALFDRHSVASAVDSNLHFFVRSCCAVFSALSMFVLTTDNGVKHRNV